MKNSAFQAGFITTKIGRFYINHFSYKLCLKGKSFITAGRDLRRNKNGNSRCLKGKTNFFLKILCFELPEKNDRLSKSVRATFRQQYPVNYSACSYVHFQFLRIFARSEIKLS
jgi:hypothetical protein